MALRKYFVKRRPIILEEYVSQQNLEREGDEKKKKKEWDRF